jgi:hypothetical protein
MKFGKTFFRLMGICAFVTAALQFICWVLSKSFTFPLNFNEHVAMMSNPYYPAWMYAVVISLLFALPVYWGITVKKKNTHAPIVLTAFIFMAIWWILDMMNHSLRLFFVHNELIVSYSQATSEIVKINIQSLYNHMDGIFRSLAFPRIPLLLVATFLYFLATWRSRGLEKIVSVFLLFKVLLAIAFFVIYNVGLTWLFQIIDPFYEIVTVPGLLAIGAWLFFDARKTQEEKSA